MLFLGIQCSALNNHQGDNHDLGRSADHNHHPSGYNSSGNVPAGDGISHAER